MKEPTPFDHLLARFGLGSDSDIYLRLVQAVREGHLCIDYEEDPGDARLIFREGRLYLKAMDILEEKIARGLTALLDAKVAPVVAAADSRLNSAQRAAFERVLSLAFTIITGGPGTGKSFTIEMFVKAFEGKRVLVAAPTGKAAMQLKARLGSTHAVFSTLHKALGMGLPYTIPLDYDLVIVDEASMIDAHLWAALFEAYMPASRLVLVGDPNQLPPVECGHLFAEIVELFPNHCAHLKECLRTDRKELIELSDRVLRGEMPADAFFTEDPILFEQYAKSYASLEEAELGKQVVLCPLRKGSEGVDAINRRLAALHLGRYVPILLRQNHGHLVNGEMGFGYLGPDGLESLYFRGELFTGLDVELAFCLSVHKAQGSEFDSVLLALPKGSERFGRAAFYTAITRAKSSITFFGSKETVAEALKVELVRGSGLKHRLQQAGQKQPGVSGRDSQVLPRSSPKIGTLL